MTRDPVLLEAAANDPELARVLRELDGTATEYTEPESDRNARVLREVAGNPRLLAVFRPPLTTAAGNPLLEEDLDFTQPAEDPGAMPDPTDMSKARNNPLLDADID
jgi:hypothetical protein